MTFLFYAHSGLRYLVLVAALAALAYLGYALATRRGTERVGRILTAVFTGLLDLQIVLGLLLVATGVFYPALMGHLTMMVLAAVVAHWASATAKRGADPERALKLRLAGVGIALLLIVGGIASIGRSVFGAGAPSVLS